MILYLTFLFSLISTVSFGQEEREMMYRITDSEDWEVCGYVNKNGDTLVPFGECAMCFSDSLNYAIIIRNDDSFREPGFLAIDSRGNEVFRVFVYDNGPDYIEDGTFRIVKNGKIGYATEAGDVIIQPQYTGAWPFENGRALVSPNAGKDSDGEHSWWVGGDWFYIDKNGNLHENQEE